MCDCTNPADEYIVEAIEKLTDNIKYNRIDPGTDEFTDTVEAIAKLRASMNPNIIQQSK